ncbi:MAG: YmdB family metallophosphoesterase [Bacilli bacterium]|nr:YmdB family metallophosphoesterase [Bacilli bacterium]
MRVLFLGDIVGSIGISAASDFLPLIRKEKRIDFVIANGENATKGKGLSEEDYERISSFADAITLGNHYRSQYEIDRFIASADKLVRPLNLIHYHKGEGSKVFYCKDIPIRVTNLLGAAFMNETVKSPIETMEGLEEEFIEPIHIVDYHAESTSEKQIFAYYFDGAFTAVIGTHTHVATLDARILPNGTAYQSDAGFCGSYESIIGFDVDSTIERIVFEKGKLSVSQEGERVVYGTIIEIDENTFKTISIEPICYLEGKESYHG